MTELLLNTKVHNVRSSMFLLIRVDLTRMGGNVPATKFFKSSAVLIEILEVSTALLFHLTIIFFSCHVCMKVNYS